MHLDLSTEVVGLPANASDIGLVNQRNFAYRPFLPKDDVGDAHA